MGHGQDVADRARFAARDRFRERARRGEHHTRAILDIALELFTEQGYEKTSLRQIAERLGFSKPRSTTTSPARKTS